MAGLPDPFDCWYSEEAKDSQADDEEEDGTSRPADKREVPFVAPEVHQLTPAQEAKYRPLWDNHVNAARVELNYGKPEKGESAKSVMKKSFAKVRASHANVSLSLCFCVLRSTCETLLMLVR